MSKLDISDLRDICQSVLKREDDWYERMVVRKISVYLSRFLISKGLRADSVTMIGFSIGLAGALLMSVVSQSAILLGAFMLQVWYLFDKCDGEVARYWKYKSSGKIPASKLEFELNGVYLDNILHYALHALIFVFLSIGIFKDTGSLLLLIVGLLAAISTIFINLIMQAKNSIILKKAEAKDALIRFQGSESQADNKPSPKSKAFSRIHYICTFPFVLNMLTLSCILSFFGKGVALILFLVFYGIVMPFVWISKFAYYIRTARIDTEYNHLTR